MAAEETEMPDKSPNSLPPGTVAAQITALERRVARLEVAVQKIEHLDSVVGAMGHSVNEIKTVIMGPKESMVTRLTLIERDMGTMSKSMEADTKGKYQIIATMISSFLAFIGMTVMAGVQLLGGG